MDTLKPHHALAIIGTCVCLLATACSTSAEHRSETSAAQTQAVKPLAPRAKNVILFIGDGMGVSSVTAIRILDGQQKGMPGEENVLSFERFPYLALSKTYEVNQQVGESAGTATAILTGRKTNAGFIDVSKEASARQLCLQPWANTCSRPLNSRSPQACRPVLSRRRG